MPPTGGGNIKKSLNFLFKRETFLKLSMDNLNLHDCFSKHGPFGLTNGIAMSLSNLDSFYFGRLTADYDTCQNVIIVIYRIAMVLKR